MNPTTNLLLEAALLVVAVFLGWALVARWRSLPCPVWLRWFVEMENPLTRETRSDVIVGRLEAGPGMRVLDLGCGPGRVTLPLAKKVGPTGQVVAVDLQKGMLARAEAQVKAAGLANVTFLRAAAGGGALGLGRFDRAVLSSVLGEIPDREGALAELFAALVPGGILSVTETVFDPHYQAEATVTRLAAGAGFRRVRSFGNRLAFTVHLEKPQAS